MKRSLVVTALVSGGISAAVSLAIVFVFVGGGLRGTNGTATAQTYPQIRASGKIRAAFAVGVPLFVIDPNTGQKSGIFYDITNAAASHLGLKVDWTEEVGYGQMIQGLNDRRYDIVGSGVWINADRGKSADFTAPVYYDAVYAYMRTGNTRFSGTSNLNSPSVTISTMDGELGATIAKTDFPLAKTLELPQSADFTQLILNVVDRKADIVFLAAAPARAYQAANPGKITAVDPNKPVRIFPNAIMIPQGQYELKQALDYALMEMLNDGEIDTILKKYEKQPGSFLRVAAPYQIPAANQ
jgi:polar amino acid transport system substrate-binding protein